MFDKVREKRYEIRQQLGKKAGRRTLLAWDKQNQELVVIKLLSFGNDLEWEDFKLFEREAKTLKNLSHPAIPRYLDYFEVNSPNNKGFALVQSYIPAKSLEEQMKAGRTFTESEVQEIAKDILRILTYLHQHQPPIIHRDIKPSNILLTNSSTSGRDEVYLVDFGSVQNLAAKEGGTVTVVGTYGYMPPEQFGGRAVPASDLYSLGATLIYLITGTHPADLPQKNLRIEFEKFTNNTPGFSRWLKLLTEPSLDRRLRSAKAALKDLENPLVKDAISLVSKKPSHSKVILNKTADSLKFTVFERYQSHILFFGLFALAWNYVILKWMWEIGTLFTAPSDINFFFVLLFSIPFWGIGIGVCIGIILVVLFNLFGKSIYQINEKEISVIYQLFVFKLNFRPGIFTLFFSLIGWNPNSRYLPKKEINKLELVLVRGVPWAIAIRAETRLCQLRHGLTPPEIEWLSTELSDWLKMPIQPKRYPGLPLHRIF